MCLYLINISDLKFFPNGNSNLQGDRDGGGKLSVISW